MDESLIPLLTGHRYLSFAAVSRVFAKSGNAKQLGFFLIFDQNSDRFTEKSRI